MERLFEELLRVRFASLSADSELHRWNVGTIMSRGVKKHHTMSVRKMVMDTVMGTLEMLEKTDKNVLSDVSKLKIDCKFGMDGAVRPHDQIEVGYCCRIANWEDEELFISGFTLLSISTESGKVIWKNPDPESGLYCRYLRMEFIHCFQLPDEMSEEKKRLTNEFAALPANLPLREGLVLDTAASTCTAEELKGEAVNRFAKIQMEWVKDGPCIPHLGEINLEKTDPRVVMKENKTATVNRFAKSQKEWIKDLGVMNLMKTDPGVVMMESKTATSGKKTTTTGRKTATTGKRTVTTGKKATTSRLKNKPERKAKAM